MSTDSGWKCRQCGCTSGDSENANDIVHKMDCSYDWEIRSLSNEVIAVMDEHPYADLGPYIARLERFCEKM